MSNELTGREICNGCGQKIPLSNPKLSVNNFRRCVNEITDLDGLINFKTYLRRFIESRCRVKATAINFIETLEKLIEDHDHDIEYIRTWLLEVINDPIDCEPSKLSREMYLYRFLQSNYSEINETFTEFYENYVRTTDTPLGKNSVSRSLNALGLKSVMKKLNIPGRKPKCCMVLYATKDELSEILQKNGI